MSNGNETSDFRLGLTNLGATGTMPGGKLSRNTISMKSEYDVSERINVSVNGNYTRI